MATLIVPPIPVPAQDDAVYLNRAFKGSGSDVAAVIKILAHRDSKQRALIQQEYKTIYSEDLLKRLSSEFSGNLEKALHLWMLDPAERDAVILGEALKKGSLEIATEVICTRTSSQIEPLKQAYRSMYNVDLEHAVEKHTSGDHKMLLVAYVRATRHEGLEVDAKMVEEDEKALYKAGEKRLGTDEETFIRIFSERSRKHLAAINSAYRGTHNKSLRKVVKSETSGKFELALLTILRCAKNPARYFAKEIHKAMKGTDDPSLIRLIVTRTEVDMYCIKGEYQKMYDKSLNDAVHSKTSSHCRTLLLTLLGPFY